MHNLLRKHIFTKTQYHVTEFSLFFSYFLSQKPVLRKVHFNYPLYLFYLFCLEGK